MTDLQKLVARLEKAARRLREMAADPQLAFDATRSLPTQLGVLWSSSPLARAKSFRATLIDQWTQALKAVLDTLGWEGQIIVSRKGVQVELDGVRLHADQEYRFFRKSGRSAGTALFERLRQIRPQPETVIDIGANIGEIALLFAHKLPEARIVAVEASSENVIEFERNRSLQPFATDHLQLIHAAVTDREGSIDITVGAGDMNTVLVEGGLGRLRDRGTTGVEQVRAITLDSVIEAAGGGPIDFLKIDIEGAEPLLADALVRHADAIMTIFVEFSVFNTLEAYVDLNDRLLDAGYSVFDSKMRPIAEPSAWLAESLAASPGINLWYVHRDAGTDAQ
ncbi:MAG: FkbM family methyltransferase [Thalassobaculum sp.]|uniref:FkbM family methyltransferase n=1 Tax=Thalassobaculum sp. TaxID=2022740 RepID=UPI0032EAE8B6